MEAYEYDRIYINDIELLDDFTAGRVVQKLEDEGITVGPGRQLDVYSKDCIDDAVADYIRESLWAFSPDFLACETGIDSKAFESLAQLCEGANYAIDSMIDATCGMDSFVDSVVGADGYGHFMSHYDGMEEEIDVDGQTYFIFRN